MVRVTHRAGIGQCAKNVDDPIFLLTNGAGVHFALGTRPTSRYQGGFLNIRGEIYKIIENVTPLGTAPVTEVRNYFWKVERNRGNLVEEFFLPAGVPAVVYRLSTIKEIEIDLDCRRIFDSRQFGRHYSIREVNGYTAIEFTKRTDQREDPTDGKQEFRLWIVLNKPMQGQSHFVSKSYAYDDERGTQPHERYIFHAGTAKSDELIITFGSDLRKAIRMNEHTARELRRRMHESEKRGKEIAEFAVAKSAASHGLATLYQRLPRLHGLYAGLYWFPQFWSRDELVCIRGLLLSGKQVIAKELLWKHLHRIGRDGYLPNRFPPTVTKSIDAVGWLWKAVGNFLEARSCSRQELQFLKRQLLRSLRGLRKKNSDFIRCGAQETWMDTIPPHRDGARIEIQCMFLNMLRLYANLCERTGNRRGKADAILQERAFAEKVRKAFWQQNYLKDGSEDPTIRPNVFLAYIFYPQLLPLPFWEACFGVVLQRLWNDWGGLSTIDKSDGRFAPQYTGENDRSYHQGDSWFWINNLAAVAMHRVNAKKFAPYIKRILEASTYELLWNGIVGYSAELSSSARLESKGCLAQAWSMATYLELVEELKVRR